MTDKPDARNSDDLTQAPISTPEDDHFHEQVETDWRARHQGFSLTRAIEDHWRVLLLGLGVIALVATVLLRLISPSPGGSGGVDALANVQARLNALENQMNAVAGLQKQMDHLERELNMTQAQPAVEPLVEPLVVRLNRMEENLALRMAQFESEIKAIQQKMAAPASAPARPQAPASAAPARSPAQYQVQPGDTLYSISRQHNLTLEELLKLNNLARDSVIKSGQTLIVAP